MTQVGIDFSGLQEAIAQIESRGRNLSEFTPVAADILVSAVLEVFDQEGPGWEPTQRGGKILQDTSVLVGSISPDSDAETAEAFTNVPYGKFHLTGTKNMAQRDFFAIDQNATLAEIAEAILLDLDS